MLGRPKRARRRRGKGNGAESWWQWGTRQVRRVGRGIVNAGAELVQYLRLGDGPEVGEGAEGGIPGGGLEGDGVDCFRELG